MSGSIAQRCARRGARTASLVLTLVASTILSGCASQVHEYYYGRPAASEATAAPPVLQLDLVRTTEGATDALLAQAKLDATAPVIVGTLVQVDRVDRSSRLGRTLSEQIAGRMTQAGVRVTEVKMRETLSMQRHQGELLLTRELSEASQSHAAQAVLVGTYSVAADQVYISLKLVRPEGNAVVAAVNYALPLDENVHSLLMAR